MQNQICTSEDIAKKKLVSSTLGKSNGQNNKVITD